MLKDTFSIHPFISLSLFVGATQHYGLCNGSTTVWQSRVRKTDGPVAQHYRWYRQRLRRICSHSDFISRREIQLLQPRSQGLSSLLPLVVGTETLVAASHVTTQNLGGRKICWKGGATGFSSRPSVLEYPPTLRFWCLDGCNFYSQLNTAIQRVPNSE